MLFSVRVFLLLLLPTRSRKVLHKFELETERIRPDSAATPLRENLWAPFDPGSGLFWVCGPPVRSGAGSCYRLCVFFFCFCFQPGAEKSCINPSSKHRELRPDSAENLAQIRARNRGNKTR
ncbi:hypothetical protein B0H17DRAFT_1085855 [Mycena rosella]|uniref:Secreted protein n=1 Tax=Mycena rosella TaxID=1033263 RepID=A0AAD7D010_MYCRO|nr:hypothetical protein B0H17DRAFT_1085855 [Mycena rosella]